MAGLVLLFFVVRIFFRGGGGGFFFSLRNLVVVLFWSWLFGSCFFVVLARQFDGVVGVVGGDRIRCW